MKKILLLFALLILYSAHAQLKLEVSRGIKDGSIKATVNTPFDIGNMYNIFDGDIVSLARTPSVNPLIITLEFPNQVAFNASKLVFGTEGNWTIETAPTINGTYTKAFNARPLVSNTWDTYTFPSTVTAKVVRLTAQRVNGDDFVHLNEWELYTNAPLVSYKICPDQYHLIKDAKKQFTLYGFDANSNSFTLSTATYASSNSSIVSTTSSGYATAVATGTATMTATYNGTPYSTSIIVDASFVPVKAAKKIVKVALIMQDPQVSSQGNQRLSAAIGWANPDALAASLITEMTNASDGTVEFQIAYRVNDNTILTKLNGVAMTANDLYTRYKEPPFDTLVWVDENNHALGKKTIQIPYHSLYTAHNENRISMDYNTLISTYDLCTKRNNGDIDEVWVYGHPYTKMYESRLTGPGAFEYNSPPLIGGNTCSKLMVIMGFNYERGVAEAMHSIGHRAENALREAYGRLDQSNINPNPIELFTKTNRDLAGKANVGSIHFPANGTSDYDYGNTTSVTTYADNWSTYPLLQNKTRTVNCNEWQCNELGYMRWWFAHLPRWTGETDGVLNDWWKYIVDFEGARAAAIAFPKCATTVVSNVPPTVSITAPANNASLSAGDITITATAADANGTVSKVEFFRNGTKLGEDLTTPYSYSWTGVAAGTYALTAIATDNQGATTASSIINITVTGGGGNCASLSAYGPYPNVYNTGDRVKYNNVIYESQVNGLYNVTPGTAEHWWKTVGPCGSGNVAPTATITSPANNAVFTAPATISIVANASDADGTIAKVEFYQNGTKIGEDLTAPYAYSWTNVAAANYVLTVKATDNAGASTTSAGVNITSAAPNQLPTANITAPANNATFTAPATVNITATATDADGTVSKVEFYQNGTKIGEDLSSPYAFSWTSVAAGTYALTAKATDNLGATKTSTSINITVTGNQLPTANITAPANNATFIAPATVNITATATDADGTVSKVEFYQNGTKIGEDLSSPYAFSWTSVAAGTYALTAKATDNLGATKTSTSINITVTGNQLPTANITAPANNATFTAPAAVNITATATDADGTVSKVEFYQNGTKIGEDLSSPYAFSWTSVVAGSYALTAKSTDNLGATKTSTAVNISVTSANQLPTANITAPANNATFTAPATVNITATATDADGTVSKVEFYQNGTKIGEDLSSPYAFNWTSVAAGTYALTAKSTDNLGATKTSTAVNITVNGSGGCSSAQWTVGNGTYIAGTVVKNTVSGVVRKYSCTIGGWCQSTSAFYYEPGNGIAWQDCWTDLGVCNARTGDVEYAEESFSVYPNPANATLTISGIEGYVHISVINSTGVEVLSKELTTPQNLSTDLDVQPLRAGIYTIKITSGERVILKQFIKN